jgi:hypothetical protein
VVVIASMKNFAPDLHRFTLETLASVEAPAPIDYPYEDHPFSAVTFNIGPAAYTKPHKDIMDLGWGWCVVTSMGEYDHTKGGHLVLWDLKLAVEFPPYSSIFIPSAVLGHSNATVGLTEHRSSVTQYNTEGLFRWVAFDNDLKRDKDRSGKDWWDQPKHMFKQMSG